MANAKFLSALALVILIASPQFVAGQSITFTKDIAPILQEKWQACHRPHSMAPMPLVTYEDVRPWAKAIRERVLTRQMPPWHIDKTVGIQKFKNDRSLSDAQIDTILKWVDAGAATTATFSTPGEYILRAQANDASGDGGAGFQCCWTNVHVKVTVAPAR